MTVRIARSVWGLLLVAALLAFQGCVTAGGRPLSTRTKMAQQKGIADLGAWEEHRPAKASWHRMFRWGDVKPDPQVRHRWTSSAEGMKGCGYAQAWSYMLTGAPTETDMRLSVEACIESPAALSWGRDEGSSPFNYHGGEETGGYDFAAIVRFAAPDQYYRVQVSHRWQEVVLWKSTGGVVRVVPAVIPAGRDIKLQVEASGKTISARLDGKELISYTDTHDPILAGRHGVGIHESKVVFRTIAAEAVRPPAGGAPTVHIPHFEVKEWHGQKWVFDGQEPVVRISMEDMNLHQAKLRPGWLPQLIGPMYWQNYLGYAGPAGGAAANHLEEFEIDSTGLQVKAHWSSYNKQKSIHSEEQFTLKYNASANMYEYYFDTVMEVQPGFDWDADAGLEFFDPIPYNACGMSAEYPGGPPSPYRWLVHPAKDGTITRRAMNHFWGPVRPYRKKGGFVVMSSDLELSPIFRLISVPEDENIDATFILCAWGYDLHLRLRVNDAPGGRIPEGTRLPVKFMFTGITLEETQKLLEQSVRETNQVFDPEKVFPTYVSGVNNFDPEHSWNAAEPTCAQHWSGGTWDKEVGCADSYSMRLDGPGTVSSHVGPSAFSGPVAEPPHRVSAMIKTKDLQEKKLFFYLKAVNASPSSSEGYKGSEEKLPIDLAGTNDWTRVEQVTEFPNPYLYDLQLGVGLEGEGTVWIDDFVFEPVVDQRH